MVNTRVYVIGGGDFSQLPDSMFSIRQLVPSAKGDDSYDLNSLEKCKYARHGHSCCSLGENYIVVTGSRKDIDRAPHRTEIYNTL